MCDLILKKVVPRLLLPLQSEGRTLKPCLVHGDCWDGNTAMDKRTDEAFIFDVCSFYGHSKDCFSETPISILELCKIEYLSPRTML